MNQAFFLGMNEALQRENINDLVLNKYGQRISIRVELPRKNGDGMISFITGWMVKPNGHIQLNTPYGVK